MQAEAEKGLRPSARPTGLGLLTDRVAGRLGGRRRRESSEKDLQQGLPERGEASNEFVPACFCKNRVNPFGHSTTGGIVGFYCPSFQLSHLTETCRGANRLRRDFCFVSCLKTCRILKTA